MIFYGKSSSLDEFSHFYLLSSASIVVQVLGEKTRHCYHLLSSPMLREKEKNLDSVVALVLGNWESIIRSSFNT